MDSSTLPFGKVHLWFKGCTIYLIYYCNLQKKKKKKKSHECYANSVDPDQTQYYAASDLQLRRKWDRGPKNSNCVCLSYDVLNDCRTWKNVQILEVCKRRAMVLYLEDQTCITKTYLYNFDPLKPHFYIVKLGFTGVYIIFLISAQKHGLWVLFNVYTQSMFWAEIWKISVCFYLKTFMCWRWNFRYFWIDVFS